MSVAPARTIVYDGIYTLAGRLLRTLLAIGLGVLLARLLGPYQRGLYALPTAVYTGLVLSLFTGISLSVSYFMLTKNAGREIVRPALQTCGIFSAAGAIPVAAAALLGHNAWAVLPSVVLLPTTAASMVLLGYAVGSRQIRWQTNYAVASTAALLAGVGAALWFFSHTAVIAATAFVAVTLCAGALCLWIVYRDARTRPGTPVRLLDFILYALRTGIVNLVTLLNYRADLYVVAILASTAMLGQYAVAVAAAEGLLVITQVGAIVTSPHVGAMAESAAAKMTATCVRATLVMSLPICALFFVLAPYIVHLLYGAAYAPLVPALRVLLVAVLILSVASPVSNFFTLNRGKPEVALASALLAACVCMAVSWLLVPRIGMIGAAAATAVAYLLGESLRMFFFIRASGTPLRAMLIPTSSDVQFYVSMAGTLTRDAARAVSSIRSAARGL